MAKSYYHSQESVDEYLKAAEGFDGAFLIEKLKEHLQKKSSLLELGSGPGKDWKLLNKFYTVTGSDYSKEFIKRLEFHNPKGTFIHLNAATLETNQQFQAIYSNKVLHHLTNTELALSIKRQSTILSNNGIVCHSFWKGKGDEEFKGMFVNYHTIENIRTLFEELFEIILLEEYKEFESKDSILLIASNK